MKLLQFFVDVVTVFVFWGFFLVKASAVNMVCEEK